MLFSGMINILINVIVFLGDDMVEFDVGKVMMFVCYIKQCFG